MKSFIYGLAIIICLCGIVAAVPETMVSPMANFISSGTYTGGTATPTTVIISGGGIGAFGGLIMNGDGTNNHTLTVYDSAAASSGTVLFRGTCTSTSYTCVFALPWPISFSNGLVAYVNAGTPSFVIYYDNRGK